MYSCSSQGTGNSRLSPNPTSLSLQPVLHSSALSAVCSSEGRGREESIRYNLPARREDSFTNKQYLLDPNPWELEEWGCIVEPFLWLFQLDRWHRSFSSKIEDQFVGFRVLLTILNNRFEDSAVMCHDSWLEEDLHVSVFMWVDSRSLLSDFERERFDLSRIPLPHLELHCACDLQASCQSVDPLHAGRFLPC